MRKVLLILFLSTAAITSYSQIFDRGSITLKSGEKIEGYLSVTYWNQNPNRVRFRETRDGKMTVYNPDLVSSFQIGPDRYIGATVQTELTDNRRPNQDPSFIYKEEEVFLKVLFEGDKSLYYYNNEVDKDVFYIQNGEELELLLYKKYLEPSEKPAD